MKWASAVSQQQNLNQAIAEAVNGVAEQLDNQSPDLVMVFVSEHHGAHFDQIPELLSTFTGDGILLGCSAGGVIGDGVEVEERPGVSLIAAKLPEVSLMPIRMESTLIPESNAAEEHWEHLMHVKVSDQPNFILLPDPFTFEAERFLSGLDTAFPDSQKMGGLVSGGEGEGSRVMFLGKRTYRHGMVGVAMHGNLVVDTLVAQGCRPIGHPMFVTRCQGSLVQGLDGRDPVEVLQELYESLDAEDRELFSDGLHIGIAMKQSMQKYRQGDFLIRNVIGMEADSEALIVGAHVKDNSVVQFHLRDARTSDTDLDEILHDYVTSTGSSGLEGSLLFSCMGRGQNLYGHPNHDVELFKKYFGAIPVGGFFCNGEIGPVQGTTFLHGFTSSFGLFKKRHS